MVLKNRKKIILYGCGDMGIQTFNILKHDKSYEILGFIDDNLDNKGKSFLGLPILGDYTEIPNLVNKLQIKGGIAVIGNNKIRYEKNQIIKKAGLEIVTAIHPKSFIDNQENIGDGTIVEMGAFIHPEVRIGEGCFICCGAIVAHNSTLGNYVLLAGGCVFGSRVTVGDFSLIGVGANISPYVNIGKNVLVGTGAAVIKDLPDNVVAAGVPAKILRNNG